MIRRLAGPIALLAMTALASPALADLYEWTDDAGVLHYTSEWSTIPERYRPGARDIGSPRTREAPPAGETRRESPSGVMTFQSGSPVVASVLVNGVALRLMVDTGADRTLISPGAAARTGLPLEAGRNVRVLGVTGGALANEALVAQLDVAGTRLGPLRVIVLETPGEGLDGLLGRDVLDSFTLTVDARAGVATLTPR